MFLPGESDSFATGWPLQIVIKMVRCNGQPVAKLSDSPGKNMCDDKAYLAYLRQVFGIEQPTEEESASK